MVRAADGSKMSKSKGNVVNPLHVIGGASIDTLVELLKSSNLPAKEIAKYEKVRKYGICAWESTKMSLMVFDI